MKAIICAVTVALATTFLVSAELTSATAAGRRYTVTAYASATSLTLGQRVTLRGKVVPNAKGTKVTVQVRNPGSAAWRNVRTVKLSRASKYVVAVVPNRAGSVSYRVLKSRSSGHAAGVSAIRTVTVSRWRALASMPNLAPSVATTVASSVVLGENVYRPAIRQESGSGAYYALGGKCTRLESFLGGNPDAVGVGPFTAHMSGAPMATPHSYSQILADDQVFPGDNPVFIRRGASSIAGLAGISLFTNGFVDQPHSGVTWAATRVYCAS